MKLQDLISVNFYLKSWQYLFIKRILDILITIPVILLFSPFFVFLCMLIMIESKGSPIFLQDRVGLKGKIFRIYKLRTMRIDASKVGPELTESNDPRITSVGKFLRRFSLDEIPQLLNILLGDMTIVGWRPEIPSIVKDYTEEQKEILLFTPGLTGYAQINGRQLIPLADKLRMDINYSKKATIFSDIVIILKTFGVVLSNKGNL